MHISEAIKSYETWLRAHTTIINEDLKLKHQKMAGNPFFFFRATYFRWAQSFEKICPTVIDVPIATSVGDLHIENYGTWRDQEGRLIWGINDFDEAFPLPITNDLVRLTVSAFLAIEENHLRLSKKAASAAVLKGYLRGIRLGGKPFVLEEKHSWLRAIALSKLKEPVRFWERFEKLPKSMDHLSDEIVAILNYDVPPELKRHKIAHRISGLGSLGLQRYIAMGKWKGGYICREVKALPVPAHHWLQGSIQTESFYGQILKTAIRCPDPYFNIHKRWTLRRLSPHCSKINLNELPVKRDEERLLEAMGFETANIHLGSLPKMNEIENSLKKFPANWLHKSSKKMEKFIRKDWEDYLYEMPGKC